MRAERLAGQIFFPTPRRCGTLIFVEISVYTHAVHRIACDISTSRSYCSCPFQPKPCVHAEAFRLFCSRAGATTFEEEKTPPDWLPPDFLPTDLPVGGEPDDFQISGKPVVEEDAVSSPLERMGPGFEDLEIWLLDTLRRGVATAVSEDPDFYKNIATRLADASMRGLSRSMRLLENLPADSSDWPEQTAAVLAEAAMALQAFRRRNHLPPALLRDLEAVVGIAPKKEAVRTEGEPLHDTWAVLGVVEEVVEPPLRQRRIWLLGSGSERYALLLDYAYGGPEFLPGFKPGTILEGELIFYPSAWPHRALASESVKTVSQAVEDLPGYEKIEDMARSCAAALGRQPWLQAFPATLRHVVPFFQKKQFGIADRAGKQTPLANPESVCWSLLALGGGRPITVFGEWNGRTFTVLSALVNERFVPF